MMRRLLLRGIALGRDAPTPQRILSALMGNLYAMCACVCTYTCDAAQIGFLVYDPKELKPFKALA
jgi:hypothetical protein